MTFVEDFSAYSIHDLKNMINNYAETEGVNIVQVSLIYVPALQRSNRALVVFSKGE